MEGVKKSFYSALKCAASVPTLPDQLYQTRSRGLLCEPVSKSPRFSRRDKLKKIQHILSDLFWPIWGIFGRDI